MSLVELLNVQPAVNPLSGVKRPLLGNPVNVPKQLPAFRGREIGPSEAIKVPKLSQGNRPNRGTNETVPIARVSALNSITTDNGRLSPGDIAFAKRTPEGYGDTSKSLKGMNSPFVMPTTMLGVDGVNRLLSGTIDGSRAFVLGKNALKGADAFRVDLFGRENGKPVLSTLFEYRLDGIVRSNDEPYSFSRTCERDATIFNITIRGQSVVNNGFLTYANASPTEMYSRGHDPLSYNKSLRVSGEHSANTWHGKSGHDFVASYTGIFTNFPLQMFDRAARCGDTVYLILRRYNLELDVIAPRVELLMAGTEALSKVVARTSVVSRLRVYEEDGKTRIDLSTANARKIVFFQYLPCSSRAFNAFHHVLKQVDEKVVADDLRYPLTTTKSAKPVAGKVIDFARLQTRRAAAFRNPINGIKETTDEHDAVRFLDILHAAGAWKVGTVIDGRSSAARPYAGGPTSTSFRMSVNVDLQWLPRNVVYKPEGTVPETTEKLVEIAKRVRDPKTFEIKNRLHAVAGSAERAVAGSMATRTLAGREFHEGPMIDIRENIRNYPISGHAGDDDMFGAFDLPEPMAPVAAPVAAPVPAPVAAPVPVAPVPKAPVPVAAPVPAAKKSMTTSPIVEAALAARARATAAAAAAAKTTTVPPPTVAASSSSAVQRPPPPSGSGSGSGSGGFDEAFDALFGASATPQQRSPLASPSSPTPSSGSESGPRAFARRNR